MKYLIVGLGNIGEKYANTRHNIGFMILDALAEASNIFFKPDRYAEIAETKFAGRKLILVKPSTYMNLSGKAVRYWMNQEKIKLENVLILTDDLALPVGKIRLRGKGSDGGHNGLKNINELLGTTKYARLRFGVGDNFSKGKQIDYVLGNFTSEENTIVNPKIEDCIAAIKSFARVGLNQTMTHFNKK